MKRSPARQCTSVRTCSSAVGASCPRFRHRCTAASVKRTDAEIALTKSTYEARWRRSPGKPSPRRSPIARGHSHVGRRRLRAPGAPWLDVAPPHRARPWPSAGAPSARSPCHRPDAGVATHLNGLDLNSSPGARPKPACAASVAGCGGLLRRRAPPIAAARRHRHGNRPARGDSSSCRCGPRPSYR
jgi:hypothetical protein